MNEIKESLQFILDEFKEIDEDNKNFSAWLEEFYENTKIKNM